MMSNLLSDPRLYEQLERIDQDLAQEIQKQGCSHCGGRLHSANYPRRPRGGLRGGEVVQRLSFCCEREGCRRRATPPSVRFLGRYVYLSAVVVLVSAMHHGLTAARYRQLKATLGVSRRTVERWRSWWRSAFASSLFWQWTRANVMPPPCDRELPGSLLDSFTSDELSTRLVCLLRCIAPITTQMDLALWAGRTIRRGCP